MVNILIILGLAVWFGATIWAAFFKKEKMLALVLFFSIPVVIVFILVMVMIVLVSMKKPIG